MGRLNTVKMTYTIDAAGNVISVEKRAERS